MQVVSPHILEEETETMSTFKVTMEPIRVHPHGNADLLELAQVGLYRAVIPKGVYTDRQYALYIPEQAIIPDDLIEELGLTGKLAGKAKNRVKAVRLRGELSQGIVCMPKAMEGKKWREGEDFAEFLGITKYAPEIPTHLAGVAVSGVDLLPWADIENLQRYPDLFEAGEPIVATEKIHGTCLIATMIRGRQNWFDRAVSWFGKQRRTKDELLVSSKGLAANRTALAADYKNLYWRAVLQHEVRAKMARILDDHREITRVGVFGEVFGAGVQDLHYGMNTRQNDKIGFRVFNIALEIGGQVEHVSAHKLPWFCMNYGLEPVPVLYSGPFDVDVLREKSRGISTLVSADHIREGLVVRPIMEFPDEPKRIAKLISPEYLLRNNGTEYE